MNTKQLPVREVGMSTNVSGHLHIPEDVLLDQFHYKFQGLEWIKDVQWVSEPRVIESQVDIFGTKYLNVVGYFVSEGYEVLSNTLFNNKNNNHVSQPKFHDVVRVFLRWLGVK